MNVARGLDRDAYQDARDTVTLKRGCYNSLALQCIREAPNYHQNKGKINRSKIGPTSPIFVISICWYRNDRRAPLVQKQSARSSGSETIDVHTCYEKVKYYQFRHVLIICFKNGFNGSIREPDMVLPARGALLSCTFRDVNVKNERPKTHILSHKIPQTVVALRERGERSSPKK